MHFSVVADRSGVLIFNRSASAQSALALATQRREEGAVSVFVYDARWALIDAPALRAAAHAELASAPDQTSRATSVTIRVGGKGEGDPPRRESKPAGRVRIFRGRRSGD